MDNLTHTLAGLLAAELALRVGRREPAPRVARAAYWVSALASNSPDLDFVYVGITDGRLGYLLHHRGHTHTFALALPLAVLTLGVYWLLGGRQGGGLARRELGLLAGLALFGPILHVGMDFANVYGVHPFWPFDSRWIYGDSVFIVEPLFWMAALPTLFFAVRSPVGKTMLGLLLSATAVLPVASRLVAWPFALAVPLGTVALLAAAWRLGPRARALLGLVASVGVLGVLVTAGQLARSKLRAVVAERFPGDVVHDLVLSPLPANPTCWEALVVTTTARQEYAVHRASVALAPWLVPAERCGMPRSGTTARLVPARVESTEAVHFEKSFVAPVAELRELDHSSCEVAAFLRFSRVPFWLPRGESEVVVGDLRFDRSPDLDFAELSAERRPGPCPRFVPGWQPPRSDLLSPPR